jgi:hypothetical protein
VLEELGDAGRDVGVGAGAGDRVVMLDEDHRDQRDRQDDQRQIRRPGEVHGLGFRPSVAADRIGAECEPAEQHERQRDRVGDGGEAEHRQLESRYATTCRQHPEELVALELVRQQQSHDTEACETEHHRDRQQCPQHVRDRAQRPMVRAEVKVPAEHRQRDQQRRGQRQPWPAQESWERQAGRLCRASCSTRLRNTGLPSR